MRERPSYPAIVGTCVLYLLAYGNAIFAIFDHDAFRMALACFFLLSARILEQDHWPGRKGS